jgi:hypothetical protein
MSCTIGKHVEEKMLPDFGFLVSAPGLNHAMFPQMASPHVSILTCTAPLSRDHVPKTSFCETGICGKQECRQSQAETHNFHYNFAVMPSRLYARRRQL